MKKYQAVLDKFKTLSDDFNISINLPIEIKDGNLIVNTKMIDITLQEYRQDCFRHERYRLPYHYFCR